MSYKIQEMQMMAAEDHPQHVLQVAREKNYPTWMDDPSRKHWHGKTLAKMDYALAAESVNRAVKGPEFTQRDSMRYPTVNYMRGNMPNELKAVLIGMLAETVHTVKAHSTFESDEDYMKAYDTMVDRYRDWSLADFRCAFKRIQTGDAGKLGYRFNLPDLCDALDKWQETKVDEREKWVANKQRYDQGDPHEMFDVLRDIYGISAKQRAADRVEWMHGKDVMGWADKQKLQARDNEQRNNGKS